MVYLPWILYQLWFFLYITKYFMFFIFSFYYSFPCRMIGNINSEEQALESFKWFLVFELFLFYAETSLIWFSFSSMSLKFSPFEPIKGQPERFWTQEMPKFDDYYFAWFFFSFFRLSIQQFHGQKCTSKNIFAEKNHDIDKLTICYSCNYKWDLINCFQFGSY